MIWATHRPISSTMVTALANSPSQRLPVTPRITSWYCVTLLRRVPVSSVYHVSSLI